MNTTQRQKANFFKLMNNSVFGKAMENLVTTERRRNYLVSEPNYHNAEIFHRKSISNINEKY